MIIYRVETMEGNGFYNYPSNNKPLILEHEWRDVYQRPHFQDDAIVDDGAIHEVSKLISQHGYADKDMISGFASKQQLRDWFHNVPEHVLDNLAECGYRIALYTSVENLVIKLDRQVIFYADASTRVRTVDMNALKESEFGTFN